MAVLLQVADLNQDGVVDRDELAAWDEHVKFRSQRRIAAAAFVFMVLLTVALCTPLVGDTRVTSLSGLISTMYVAFSGIVGAYMGVTAWMAVKK